jgi:hypothetical protein
MAATCNYGILMTHPLTQVVNVTNKVPFFKSIPPNLSIGHMPRCLHLVPILHGNCYNKLALHCFLE